MEFKISYVEFYNKIGRHFGLWLAELTFRSHYCFKEHPEIEKELGLELKGCFLNIIYFNVIDEKKFLLAKIKYAI